MIQPLDITLHQVPLLLDIFATLAWAVSGSLVARAKGFDFAGVFTIAVIATTGGGLIRDGIFLQRIPVVLTSPQYLAIALVGALLISLFGRSFERFKWADLTISMIDAIGTPSYALIGFQLAYLAGVTFWGALFIGLVNGVAGGVLRDVLVGSEVRFLRPGQHISLILLGALLAYIVLLIGKGMPSETAAWIAILFAMVARILVIRYNWHTEPVNQWAVDEALSQLPAHLSHELQSAGLKRKQPGTAVPRDE